MPLTVVFVPAAHGFSEQFPSVHVVCRHWRFTQGPAASAPVLPPVLPGGMMIPPLPFVPVFLAPEVPLPTTVELAPPAPELSSPPAPTANTDRAEFLLAQLEAAPATIAKKPTTERYLEVTRDSFSCETHDVGAMMGL